jgi:hypothetical protein
MVMGCNPEILTYNQDDMTLYKIDIDNNYIMEPVSDLSAFGIPEASALTFITDETFYLHWGETQTLFLGDITDELNPMVTELGNCPACGGGMARCADGNLYSVHAPNQIDPSSLYIIDPADLENPTLVGSLGFNTGNLGLTCQPDTDVLYVFGATPDALYTLDKTDGSATSVGAAGIDVTGGVGLEFDPEDPDTLYASFSLAGLYYLYEIDASTGAAAFLASLPKGNKCLGARTVQ